MPEEVLTGLDGFHVDNASPARLQPLPDWHSLTLFLACWVALSSPKGADVCAPFLSGSLICNMTQSGVIAGLAGERTRWEASILTLDAQLAALPGDVALASAFMSYAGPFPSEYRDELSKSTWQKTVSLTFMFKALM